MQDKNKEKQSSFQDEVYAIVREIPKGRVSTYGAIANALGTGTARMVGYAMNKSVQADIYVPAHRVVNRKGELTGRHHFSTPTRMQELLEAENISIQKDCVQDFKDKFWNPALELLD